MEIVLIILLGIASIGLVLVSALRPVRSPFSTFELTRRKKNGDKSAALSLEIRRYQTVLSSFILVLGSLLLVMIVTLSLAAFGWAIGIVVALAIALFQAFVAAQKSLQKMTRSLQRSVIIWLLRFFHEHRKIAAVFTFAPKSYDEPHLGSREELLYLIKHAEALSGDDKQRLQKNVDFAQLRIRDVMTSRAHIDGIRDNELLGPLVLDDLHKTGHRFFPVAHESLDSIVGVLDIERHFTVDGNKKHTSLVETVMDKNVPFISADESLERGLAISAKTGSTFFIVEDIEQNVVGVVTLGDCLRALFGESFFD